MYIFQSEQVIKLQLT